MAEKKLRPGQKIKMVSVDELLGCAGEESSLEIDINRIQPFQNHPFKVVDDAKMDDLVNSIRQYGVLTPVLVRPTDDGGYEMISGHRRMHAAERAGLATIPAIIACFISSGRSFAKISLICSAASLVISE